MLTIPNTVQALFKTDGTRKNLRIHFPNGEIADITNENIVYESLKFTESVCSQDPFKFGLAEASVVEFETVGIANMYGYVIEVGIEIDTTSLTAAEIAAIEVDEGDGTLVKVGDSDIGFGFYRVPLGAFRVESCPRDHQAMTHRKVTAYSLGRESEYNENPFELKKLATLLPSESTYSPRAKELFAVALGWDDPDFMTGLGYAATDISPSAAPSALSRFMEFKKADDTIVEVWIDYFYNYVNRIADTDNISNANRAMIAVDTHGVNYDDYLAEFVAFFESVGIDAAKSGYDSIYDAVYDLVKSVYAPSMRYVYYKNGTQYDPIDTVPITTTNNAVYPFLTGMLCTVSGNYSSGDGLYVRMLLPKTSFTLRAKIANVQVASETYNIDTPATVYRQDDSSAATTLDTMPIQIFSSSKATRTISGRKWQCYAFDGNADLLSFAKGNLELMAKFAKRNRDGSLSILGLDNTAPISVTPDEIDEMWWDEYAVDPIGRVLFNSVYTIGDGASLYDMTDNGALKLLTGDNINYIASLLQTAFRPNAGNIGFTPLEMTMEGLPWVEAGDAIQATTEDNLTVDSFALRIEMTGIQNLKLYIESKGGEIIS